MNKFYLITILMLICTSSQALESLTETEMSDFDGGSLDHNNGLSKDEQELKASELLKDLFNKLDSKINLLSSDRVIGNITYHEGVDAFTIQDNGDIVIRFPKNIDLLEFNNIKLSASNSDASFGNIQIKDLGFSKDSYMKITFH